MRIVILRHGGGGRAEGYLMGSAVVESGFCKQRQYDPETERALRIAAKAAKKYRNALRTLARGARRK